MPTPNLLQEVLKGLEGLPKEDLLQWDKDTLAATDNMAWIPNQGQQTAAYTSKADITYYGGAGGGGKSDLILGLAFTQHQASLIMRRQYTDMTALTKRAIEINGTRKGYNGSMPAKLQTEAGRSLEFGAAKDIGDEQHWQGQPHDLLAIDEAAQWAESQIRFLMGWVRTTEKGQRCRVVLASNPPLTDEGAWLRQMFGPWLDPVHPNPAKSGELRWYITDTYGHDQPVDGRGPHMVADENGVGKEVLAMSRTFISARVTDNPYLAGTDYERQLDALPEPLRSALRDGDFSMGVQDHDLQVIPTDWIRQAQARWKPQPPPGVPMCAMGVDVAQGGDNDTVIAPRYDGWYPELSVFPGRETPYGRDVAGRIITCRRDGADVVLDMGGGYGGATYEHLADNDVTVHKHKGSETSTARSKDGKLKFFNKRAEVVWRFREALDPSQINGSPIMLPQDPMLVADLASYRLDGLDAKGIKLEPKDRLVKRIGRSIDRGDAVIMAWSEGGKAVTHKVMWNTYEQGRHKPRPKTIMGHQAARRAAGR